MAKKTTKIRKQRGISDAKGGAAKRNKKVKKAQAVAYGRRTADQLQSSTSMTTNVNEPIPHLEVKTARYEIRFTPQQLEALETASSILGYKNATDYIRHVMHENAARVIKEQVILEIAEQDRQRFMDELMSPGKPGKSFLKGLKIFKKKFKG